MGPLAVRPDRQGEGIGSGMVRSGIDWLRAGGATTIGLETMPRTVENIGFYSRLGMVPGPLTVTFIRDAARPGRLAHERLGQGRDVDGLMEECRVLTAELSPGVDFTREIRLTLDLGLGDVSLMRRSRALCGFALWHSAPLAAGRPRDELRVLKIVARDVEAFHGLLALAQRAAQEEQVRRRVSVRCQGAANGAYRQLIALGFRVHWTDLRMTLHDAPEPATRGIVMSNWEI